MKKKYLALTAILATTVLFAGCNKESVDKDTEDKPGTEESETNKGEQNNQGLIPFVLKVEKEYTPSFHSEMKKSPSGSKVATIEGRGELAIEEGEGSLVVTDNNKNEVLIFSIKDYEKAQIAPKQVEWIDDNRLFVIAGMAHGTVSKGGLLYQLNLDTNTVKTVFDDLTDKEEITSIKANANGSFSFEKHIYIDDEFNEGRTETGFIVPLPEKY